MVRGVRPAVRPGSEGLAALRTDAEDEPDGEVTVLAAYCRACAAREFGELQAGRNEAD